jgi:hypothetical protein
MKTLRTFCLSLLLVSGVVGTIRFATPSEAFAQAIAAGGGSDACTGAACSVASLTAASAGVGITTPYLYTSGTTGRSAIILAPNQYMRWGGTSAAAGGCISYWNNSDGVNIDCVVATTQLRTQWLNLSAASLPTCDSSVEGRVLRLTGTGGGATGVRTRACLCTSDGSGAYAWQNMVSGTVGSASACNA